MLAARRDVGAASELGLVEISTSISRRASKHGPPAFISADGMENIASWIDLTCIDSGA